MLLNCGIGEYSCESLELQRDQTSQSCRKSTLNIHLEKTDVKAEAPMLWPSDAKSDSLENTLKLERLKGKGEVRRKRVRWLESITNSMDMNLSTLLEIVKDRGACCPAVHGDTKSWT